MKVKKLDDNMDHSHNITWLDGKKEVGSGFIDKDGIVHVIRCPNCRKENYMAQSICIKCGFNPEEKK